MIRIHVVRDLERLLKNHGDHHVSIFWLLVQFLPIIKFISCFSSPNLMSSVHHS